MLIKRSEIVAKNATTRNWAVVWRDVPVHDSTIVDSNIFSRGGADAMGIAFLNFSSPSVELTLDNVRVKAQGAAISTGIGELNGGLAAVTVKGGYVYGDDYGIASFTSDLTLTHTEISGATTIVLGNDVKIGSTGLLGGGTVAGVTLKCAGVFDDAFDFYPSTCP